MKQLKELGRSWFAEGPVTGILILILALQPWIDMDYLFYPFLDQFGLPRPSTLIRYLILPALILWCFFKKDKNRKKTLVLGGLYGLTLIVYFILHHQGAQEAASLLHLTSNFQYSVFQELTYCLTLVIPFGLIYLFYHLRLSRTILKQITAVLSATISIPIVISDLFVVGQSTYVGMTAASFLSWFTGIYETVEPRRLACKFFFDEGNTIGILLFMLLPLLYYYFSQGKNRREKLGWGVLISIQSLSMLILSTRVASLGTILIPAAFIVLYLFDALILKNQRLKAAVLIVCLATAAASALILPFTPAIQNQKSDAIKDDAVRGDEDLLQKGIENYEKRLELTPGTEAYERFCLKAFEKSGIEDNLISSIPKMYYMEWYPYTEDPVLWSDLLFTVPLEQRLTGRQFQTYFMNVKWSMASASMKMLGMGYTPFMNGSILLEKDFVQQKYTLGYLGDLLMCIPWVLLALGGGLLVLLFWKECLTLEVMALAMAYVCGLGASYLSGHTLDQFVTTTFMALLAAALLNRIFGSQSRKLSDVLKRFREILTAKNLMILTVALLVLQPVIDLDYLAYPILDRFGLPRPSTILRFLIIPALVLWTFFLKDKNKKRTLLFGGLYVIALGVYFILHVKQGAALLPNLYLTPNFFFSLSRELTYFLTLIIPYGLIYSLTHLHLSEKIVKAITVGLSCLTAVPVFLGDLFVFGESTYAGYTAANFISWFFNIYADPTKIHPRQLASKFFFEEGNTLGILMFMLLPLLYLFFQRSQSRKERTGLGLLIGIHSLSMIILSTRVATFGSVLIPIGFLVLYLFTTLIMKEGRIEKTVLLFTAAIAIVCGCILPYCPAVVNQRIDSANQAILLQDDYMRQEALGLQNDRPLKDDGYYRYMFEQYGIKANLMSSVPTQYYMEWYYYTADPKFWVDVMNLPLEQRVSGRQIEKIFMQYKWNELSSSQKVLGMGYSTFNNGSILLEKDFAQQIYTMGYAGFVLTVLPWLLITAVGAVLVLLKWKKLLRLDVLCYAMALGGGLVSAYISGHTIDQFLTTTFLALLVAVLLNQVQQAWKK